MGAGAIAGKVTPQIAAAPTSRLRAVASRDGSRAEAFAKEHGAERAYGSYDDLLADPDVDAVYIATPNGLHGEHAIAAARAGKHVLCEKPMAATAGEVEEIFNAAEEAGVVMMEAFMYRFHPLMREVLRRVRDGEIGCVGLIRSSFCFDIGDKPENIRLSRGLQGGAIMDIGCYCVNFSRAVTGEEPDRVSASAYVGTYGVDEWTSGVLGFPGGAVASFSAAVRCAATSEAQIYGSAGMIDIPKPWLASEPQVAFTLKRKGEKEGETVVVSSPHNRYYCQTEAFNAAVLDGAPLLLTRDDALGNARVIERLHEAIGVKW